MQFNSGGLGWAWGVTQLGPEFQPALSHFRGGKWIAPFWK